MKQVTTDAIILKRINFGEADRILTVLTADRGKLSILAKGVRRSKSKLAGGLELFSVSTITYIDGKSDLKTIISTQLKTHYDHIVADVDATMAAYDFMKLVHDFSDHTDQSDYYAVLRGGLAGLGDASQDNNVVQVWFFLQVLRVFGSSINVEKPLDANGFNEDSQYSFSYDDMSFYAHSSGEFKPNHIKFLRLAVRSDVPKKLAVVQNGSGIARDIIGMVKQAAMMHKA